MVNYGLTDTGPNPKRLDVILDEMHTDLTKELGVNTRQNPQSVLNVLLTNIADRIAELWEYGTDVYYSQYPMSAEGSSLDSAMQFAGITREMPQKSYYPILCTGVDGTAIPKGTRISTSTNPPVYLANEKAGEITRSAFSKIVLRSIDSGSVSIVLNTLLYTASSLEALAAKVSGERFNAVYTDGQLLIEDRDESGINSAILSDNLATMQVSSIVRFATEENGDIMLPKGVVSMIVKTVPGMESVRNVGTYIAGRQGETDSELRKSYQDKIFNQSKRMSESIRSAILENVQGVRSVAVYENDTNTTDEMGRPPHSIEIVASGGDNTEIAQQIFDTKAGGIATYCTNGSNGVAVSINGDYGEEIEVRFNRPQNVYVYFQVGVTFSPNVNPPTNYAELIRSTILDCMEETGVGSDVVPQKFINKLYSNVGGVDYFDISLTSARDSSQAPGQYNQRSVHISQREQAVTTKNMIGVVING